MCMLAEPGRLASPGVDGRVCISGQGDAILGEGRSSGILRFPEMHVGSTGGRRGHIGVGYRMERCGDDVGVDIAASARSPDPEERKGRR